MDNMEQAQSAAREARGFAITDTSSVTFFDVKSLISPDYRSQWLLPPAPPSRDEWLIRAVSASAGPLLLIAGYVGLARLLF